MNTANTQQIKKKNSKCEAMWSQSFFNDLVKSLDLKWGRSDADFHHIFLKERPRAPSLHSPKKLSENKWFLLLFPSFRCLMLGSHWYIIIARKISKPASQIQTHPTDGPRRVFQVSNTVGSGFVSWITESWKENCKVRRRSFWEVVFHMDQFRELPYENNCNVT